MATVENRIRDLTDTTICQFIASSGSLAVVEFWHPMCGLCAAIAPHYQRLAKRYKESCRFARISIEQFDEMREKFVVGTTPMFIFFKGGEEVGRIGGIIEPVRRLEEELKKHLEDNDHN